METGGLIEVMSMAEGAMFRLERTGNCFEPPCWAIGGCSIMERPMWFQISVMERDGEARAEVSLSLRGGMESAPSWKIWLCKDGKWDGAVCGERMLSEGEWELDSAIAKAVRMRNAAL